MRLVSIPCACTVYASLWVNQRNVKSNYDSLTLHYTINLHSCCTLDPVFTSGETSSVGFGAADQPVFSDGSRTPSIIPQVKTPIRTTTHHAGPGHM